MKKIFLMPLGLLMSVQAQAGFWPFPVPNPVDQIMKYKEIAILVEQLRELEQHGRKFASQIDGIVNVKNSIDRKMDESKRLMSGDYKYAVRHYVPELNRWGSKFQSWDRLIQKNRPHFSKGASQEEGDDDIAPKNYEAISATTHATDEVATQTYNDVDREIEVLEKLRKDMSEATNQKAITELVARINIQKAIIQAKSNRLNAVQVKMSTENSKQMLKEEKWAEEFLR